MTGSNHIVAGAIIAVSLPQPAIALPLALVSHLVLDALPHYGETNRRSWLGRHFDLILFVDAILCALFMLAIVVFQPAYTLLIIACGVVAVAPDLLWLPYYLADKRGQVRHSTQLAEFLKWIQWGERPWGIYIEIVWLIASVALFISIVN